MPGSVDPYGHQHRVARARLMRAHDDGAPCPLVRFCGGAPMYRAAELNFDGQPLHADHSDAVVLHPQAVADRLVHGSCNEKAGAILGNVLRGRRIRIERPKRGKRAEVLVTSRDW